MVTEKDLSVEQRMAVSMAIACMERNFKRNWNKLMYCQDKKNRIWRSNKYFNRNGYYKGTEQMTVKEMIIELLNCPMDAKILVEIPTTEGYKYSTSENIEHILMIDDERCLICED